MKKFIYIFLSRPITTLMIFVFVVVSGIFSYLNLPIELMPEAEYPKLSVITKWYGVSPETVEAFLTSPIESVLSGVKGLQKISSRSSEGSSVIDLEFHNNVNIDFARLEINEKLNSILEDLPVGISPPHLSPYVPKEFQELQGFLTFTLSGNQSANEIRKYAIEYIKPALMPIDGVSNIEVQGGNDREISITLDYNKIKAYSISNEEIYKGISDAEQIITAGSIQNNFSQKVITIKNTIDAVNVLLEQPIKIYGNNSVIKLKDIGTVRDDFSETRSIFRINGKESIFIEISKEQGKNTIKIADDVLKQIDEIKSNLPSGFEIKKEIDKSQNIRKEINELFANGIYSFFIIFLVLLIIFRKAKYALIIIASIIFSFLSAFIFFNIFQIRLNILTISSLVLGFGIMVDNSIVVVDYLDKKVKTNDLKRIAVHTKDIFFPVFASTLTTIAIFLPLLFFTGELKIYFEQFALAITVTLISSLIMAFVIVPLLYSKLNSRPKNLIEKENSENPKSLAKTKKSYSFSIFNFLLQKIFRYKKISFAILILMVGLPVWLLPPRIDLPFISIPYNAIFDSEFFSENRKYFNYAFGGCLNLFFNHIQKGEVFNYGETDYIIVSLWLPNGTELERIKKLTLDMEKEILVYKNNFERVITNVLDEKTAIIRINFSEEQSGKSFPYLLKNYLTSYAVRLGGLKVSIYGFGPGFFSGGGGNTISFAIGFYGFNYLRLKELAGEFKTLIEQNPRIDNVDIDRTFMTFSDEETNEIVGNLNRNKLAAYNIFPSEIFEHISNGTKGNLAYNKFRIGNDEVFYSIKYSDYKEKQLDELENSIIKTFNNSTLKVRELIDFNESKVLPVIRRENQQYIRVVTLEYKGPYQYGNLFIESTLSKLKIPDGYTFKKQEIFFLLSPEEELEIWGLILAALILVFMITSSLFESISKPLLIMLAVPFSFIGTIFLFYLGDFNLDRGAYAGLLLLVGLSVNNSILLINYLTQNYHNTGFDDIIKLTFSRVRPIITTTLTTIAALIPLLIKAEQSFWKSLSLSVIGGLIVSSFLILTIIPMLYYLFSHKLKK